MTNADKIRKLSNEQLHAFLSNIVGGDNETSFFLDKLKWKWRSKVCEKHCQLGFPHNCLQEGDVCAFFPYANTVLAFWLNDEFTCLEDEFYDEHIN